MADAQHMVTGLTRDELQAMLEIVIKAAKEPSELEKAKMAKDRADFLRREKEQLELAKAQVERDERLRNGCPHHVMYNGRMISRWFGQVHNDGLVHPVCNICRTQWPPFSATLLPDKGREGVNMEQANPSTEQLTMLHRQSFPKGCDSGKCFICKPKKG